MLDIVACPYKFILMLLFTRSLTMVNDSMVMEGENTHFVSGLFSVSFHNYFIDCILSYIWKQLVCSKSRYVEHRDLVIYGHSEKEKETRIAWNYIWLVFCKIYFVAWDEFYANGLWAVHQSILSCSACEKLKISSSTFLICLSIWCGINT